MLQEIEAAAAAAEAAAQKKGGRKISVRALLRCCLPVCCGPHTCPPVHRLAVVRPRNAEHIICGYLVQARCWMAQDFPLSLQQLLPIMDVIGYANKYLKRVRICKLQCHSSGAATQQLGPDVAAGLRKALCVNLPKTLTMVTAGRQVHAKVRAAEPVSGQAASANHLHGLFGPGQQVRLSHLSLKSTARKGLAASFAADMLTHCVSVLVTVQ
jgi:GPCR-chaperone